MPQEIWKKVEGYNDSYEASNTGHIRRLPDDPADLPKQIDFPGKKNIRRTAYLYSSLFDGHSKRFVDEIIAKTFLPEKPNDCKLIHINHDKSDDRAENLQWVPKKTDMRTHTGSRRNYVPVLQLRKDGALVRKFNSMMEAHRITGINYQCIDKTCKGEQKTAGGYLWQIDTDSVNQEQLQSGIQPCPFCGSEARTALCTATGSTTQVGIPGLDMPLDHAFVECENCHSRGKICESAVEAVKFWNKRFI